jgi:hypothetical protein
MSTAKALTFSEEIEKDVIPWLKIAEDLRSLNLESELNVPQICVMVCAVLDGCMTMIPPCHATISQLISIECFMLRETKALENLAS